MDAFWLLFGDRGTMNRITWLSMHLYAVSLGLSDELEQDMIFLVNRLDMAYLKWLAGKQKSNADAPGVQRTNAAPIKVNPR